MTTLEHKVRNPKKLDTWLDIWTADNITINNDIVNYTITPSNKWKIPITQLTLDNGNKLLNNGENIVTTNNPENTTGGLAYFNSYNVVKAIDADRGLSLETKDNKTTIGHSNNPTSSGTIGQQGDTNNTNHGSSPSIPYIEYDEYGHITSASTISYTINELTNSNIASNAKINPTKIQIKDIYNDNNIITSIGLETYVKRMISGYTPTYPNTEESFTGIFNTKDQNGIVKKVIDNNKTNTNTIWAANNSSEPDWRKITAGMFDEATKISANNLPYNSSGSAGIIPENSNPNLVWGTPSITYEEQDPLYVAQHIHDHTYYLYDENSSPPYREILDSDWANIPAGTTYYIKKEYPPQWSGVSLNKTNLNIAYDNDNSKLIIGLDEQVWTNDSENNQIPNTWSQYILTMDTNITITPSSS